MTTEGSGYDLLGESRFRNAWSANLVFILGLEMLTLGISWTMTSLTTSTVLVSMVQTASSLPFVLFAIPFGLASDSLGHRRMMLASQAWMLAVTAFLAVVALSGGWNLTPKLLLFSTFLIGVGVVVQKSSWKPLICELVPKDRVLAALSFNSLSSDIGRAVGPVLGGYLMGFFGTAVVLFTSTVSHFYLIAVLWMTPKDRTAESGDAGESRSLRQVLGIIGRSPKLYGPIARIAMLMITSGALLGLLPLEAKENVQTGPIGYGHLLAALSVGSAIGAVLVPALRRRIPMPVLSAGAVIVFGLSVIGVSQWNSMALDAMFLFFYGCAWSIVTITHLSSVQIASPENARGLMNAVFALAVQGGMAAGSFGFGLAAQQIGVSRSILIAGVTALGSLLFVRLLPVADD
ncbi:MAG: MFS transporter [Mycobacterium sp.]